MLFNGCYFPPKRAGLANDTAAQVQDRRWKKEKNLSSRRGPDVRDKEEEETLSVSRAASPFPSFSF